MGSDKIRVLIVDDIPETRENVRKLLAFESDVEVVGGAGTGQDAIQAVKEFSPDIVLMDINMPGLDGISAVEAITREAPSVQVIMMSVQSESDYLRRSMLAGARDFLTKPFTGDELISTLRRVSRMSQQRAAAMPQPVMQQVISPSGKRISVPMPVVPQPEGSVVAVYGPKGGVGTTTLAVNLAVALQKPDTKVAMIDASLQFGNLHVFLDLRGNRSIADISQTINDLDADAIRTMVTPHSSGLKVLLAPARPELADLVLADHLKRIVDEMRLMFDYIVIDTPSSLTDLVLTALDVADRIVLVTTADIPAVTNAKAFFQVIVALGYSPEKVMLVLNQADSRNPITAKMIEDNLKHKVACQIPMESDTVARSIRQGVPFITEARSRPIALAMLQMTDQLMSDLAPKLEAGSEDAAADESPRKRGARFFR